ncbi:MAG: phosphatidylserine decarboxylase [Proteobacteria bacterium]|nr:phosphatidylserine decarboxylase [Pseudomonadota bacterium]MDA0846059.1 phosphatidylserine decarboxylase [Pseudomonadota bacterium]
MNRLTNVDIAVEGWPVLAVAGAVTILVSFVALPVGCFLLGVMMWLAHILRVPNRLPPPGDDVVVAPVDGRIVQIKHCPADTGVMPLSYDAVRITIRTKLSDTQLQISPITGHLIDNCLFPGLFAPWPDIDQANHDRHQDSWEDVRRLNERREITLRHAQGHEVVMVQLATKTARQLVCRLSEGKHLAVADPIGMARLAGVTDIYVPAASISDMAIGQHVVAAETILARLPSSVPAGA